MISDHGSEFYASCRDEDDHTDYEFEEYLSENEIQQTLCAVVRAQSNGKIDPLFQTFEKHRCRFDSLEMFRESYKTNRPHKSLNNDELETPSEAFEGLLPTAADAAELTVADGGNYETK